jgi:two-component system, NtrC family, sensor kinase
MRVPSLSGVTAATETVLSERVSLRRIYQAAAAAMVFIALVALAGSRGAFGVAGPAVLALVALGAVLGLALVARAVLRTHLMRASASLHSATEALSRAEKLATMGRLAAGIAHEVGNPLSAIVTYAHLIRQRAGDAAALREPLDALEREVDRIDRIVRALLDYARPRRMTPRPVRVDEVLNDVVRLVATQGLLRRVEVQWRIEQREAAIYAERHDLEQAFVNLVLNAVEAMQGVGRLALRSRIVSASSLRRTDARRLEDDDAVPFANAPSERVLAWLNRPERPDTMLQIVVADSGPGVSDADAERIFEPFFSSKSATRGTGLGLAIVAQTVESVGGTIWVQPAREGGAAFVLLLPLVSATVMARERN